jgi:hypothetical protein
MDVEYSCIGKESITVGVAIPKEGGSLEAVIASFAPMNIWEPDNTPFMLVSENFFGELPYPIKLTAEEVANEIANLEMQRQETFEHSIATVLVKFGVLQSDPTLIKVTQL